MVVRKVYYDEQGRHTLIGGLILEINGDGSVFPFLFTFVFHGEPLSVAGSFILIISLFFG
jgi:hypothetical protein